MFGKNSKVMMTAAALTIAGIPVVSAGNLAAPTNGPIKVTKAQLGIKSPITNACPTNAKMSGWIFTNKPGTIQYMIAKKGGGVSGPFSIESKKGANGISMASFSRNLEIHNKINAEYRILVSQKYGKTLSNWVPLKASCKIKLGG